VRVCRYEITAKSKTKWVDNMKMDTKETGWGVWAGSIWLGTLTIGELLSTR
jgi:hypothetical protein